MQNYRVWEANLKVYLYPENWIEPELRDDKTPFFKELEAELLQSELTNDSAELAVGDYLQKLEAVSQLKVCGVHEQMTFGPDEDKQSVLHVFANSIASPKIFYYRQRITANANYTYWTPWEKVSLDIDAEEVLPVIWNHRLHLFWPLISEKQVNSSDPDNNAPSKQRMARLAWSSYRHGKWLAKKATPADEAIVIDSQTTPRLSARYSLLGNSLSIYFEEPEGASMSEKTSWDSPHSLQGYKQGYKLGIHGHVSFLNSNGLSHAYGHQSLWSQEGYEPTKMVAGMGLGFHSIAPVDDQDTVPVLNDSAGPIEIFQTRGTVDIKERSRPYSLENPFFLQDGSHSYLVCPHLNSSTRTNVLLSVSEDEKYLSSDPNSTARPDNRFLARALIQVSSNPWQSASPSIITRAERQRPLSNSGEKDSQQSGLMNAIKDNLSSSPLLTRFPADFRFETFFHPYTVMFQRRLSRNGIPGLLSIDSQQPDKQDQVKSFEDSYAPDSRTVKEPFPLHNVDFSLKGAYSIYNWELFFHIPLLIAGRLSKEQKFEEARNWYHYIFNPTTVTQPGTGPETYWQFLPFRETLPKRLDSMLKALHAGDPEMIAQWEDMQAHPFQPHRVARLRLVAYQKTVVMKYIDNLIAWADQDFRSDTIEAINQATHRYILAGQIMGNRIQSVPQRGRKSARTYAELREEFKTMNLAMASFENDLPFSSRSTSGVSAPASTGLLGIGRSFYFCLPKNDQLLAYWDTIADRLFKIRHCMNIDGVVRELPLFEPAIDPALLVQAAAQGLDLRSVLADLSAPLPNQRFSTLLAKALEMASELRALGSALLTALEKRDAEHLTNLREANEREILGLMQLVKQQQVKEAEEAESALRKSREVIQARFDYYSNIQQVIPEEANQLRELAISHTVQSQAASDEQIAANIAAVTYDFSTGVSNNTAYFTESIGRDNIIADYQARSREKSYLASIHSYNANLSSILSGWKRRSDDWSLQKRLAAKELTQLDRQIAAAAIRVAIANQELANTAKQIEQLQAIRDYRQNMFTGEELQTWMVGELSPLFFQFYQLTYDYAKKAEKASQYQLGLRSSNFIRFGTWDSLHKGLMSGERLALQLRQLEQAHHEANRRDYEITKEISLAQLDPLALIQLRELGWCEFSIPEELFDLDFPGHYMRRIKTVSLSIPAVVSSGVHCTLTILRDKTRRSSLVGAGYAEREGDEDDRFIINWAPVQAIATSSAINDSGLFELNLHDERTLPFEGAGAISHWRIELPDQFRQFDYNTISTLKLDLRYHSKDGGAVMKDAAIANLKQKLKDEEGHPQYRLFSLRSDFPTEWYQLQQSPPDSNGVHQQTLCISKRLFGFPFQVGTINISNVQLFGVPIPPATKKQLDLSAVSISDPQKNKVNLKQAAPVGTLVHLSAKHDVADIQNPAQTKKESDWLLQVHKKDRDASIGQLEDLLILFQFTVDMPKTR